MATKTLAVEHKLPTQAQSKGAYSAACMNQDLSIGGMDWESECAGNGMNSLLTLDA